MTRPIYKLLPVYLLMLLSTNIYAQKSASILSHKLSSYGKLNMGVYGFNGGGEGISFHLDFAVSGMQYKTSKVIIYFYDNEDRPMKGQDGYSTTDGSLCVSKEYRASYESTKFTDFQINIPYKKLGIWSTRGEHRIIKCLVVIWDDNYQRQLDSQWIAIAYSQDSWTQCTACSGTKKCGACYGRGGTGYVTSSYNPYRVCSLCKGTGACGGCEGKGGFLAASFYEIEMKHSQEPY